MNNSFKLTSLSSLYAQELRSCTYGTRQGAKNASQHPLKSEEQKMYFEARQNTNFFKTRYLSLVFFLSFKSLFFLRFFYSTQFFQL